MQETNLLIDATYCFFNKQLVYVYKLKNLMVILCCINIAPDKINAQMPQYVQ